MSNHGLYSGYQINRVWSYIPDQYRFVPLALRKASRKRREDMAGDFMRE
jgi:hypothetical protein